MAFGIALVGSTDSFFFFIAYLFFFLVNEILHFLEKVVEIYIY